jgi:glycerophosphoryl diester phosphodiesterase
MDLHRGSRGKAVKTLEQRLLSLRLLPRAQVDRFYGRRTAAAVRTFQRQHGLRVTGRVRTSDWAAVAAAVAPATPAPWTAPTWSAPAVVAHRGTGLGTPPENSVAAWSEVAPVSDVLEMDVRWTADHQMVVLHDPTLDRTTTCTGLVSAWTLADLRARCTLADGSAVPTLAEAMTLAAHEGREVAPELKPADLTDVELGQVVEVLRTHDLVDRSYVQSSFPAYFARLHALEPRLHLVYLTSAKQAPSATTVRASGADVVGAMLSVTDAAQVAAWHRAGLAVWLWTARDLATLQQMWTLGADAAVTDLPAQARQLYGAPR